MERAHPILSGPELPVPGTHHLIDLEYTKKKILHAKDRGDIILVPAPSSDPDDPLNWSRRRKLLATFCWCTYTFISGISLSNLYSVLEPFSHVSGLPVNTLNSGSGFLFLLAGWGLFFWQPFALQYGKRPVYLISILAIGAMSIWAPYIRSTSQWYARMILAGFFAAPSEAMPELSVADLYFTHERGAYMALYALVLVGSNFLAPIMFGFINDGQGWHWVFYWPAIFCGAAAVFLFFALEETNYDRVLTRAETTTHIDTSDAKYSSEATITHRSQPIAQQPRKTYLQKLSLKDKKKPFVFLKQLKLQLRCLTFPVALYSGFAYGSTLIWFNVLNATMSLVLSSPPYNFPASMVGLSYLGPVIGVCLGFFFTGIFSDYVVLRLARRNGGIMEPEQRLWLFAVSTVLIPAGLILWGVGANHGVFWFGLLVGAGMLAFANTCGVTLSVTYLVDCYREMSGSALTAVIVVRNTMSFAIGYGITPWIEGMGLQNAFISAAFVGLVASLPFLIMVKWGKAVRERSKRAYWNLVAESEANGMLH